MSTKTILYIGWVEFDNLGDDICRDLFITRIDGLAKNGDLDVNIQSLYPSSFSEYTLARINPDLVVLGAGSLFEPVYLRPLVLAQQHSIPTVIWGSGYDSADENALKMIQTDESVSADFISPDSAYMIRHVVAKADIVGLRGPYTEKVLRAIGAVHPGMHVTGDPGLLLEMRDSPSDASAKRNKKPHIAVNWGTARNNVFGHDEQAAAEALTKALSVLKNDLLITIYPVWKGDIAACSDLAAALDDQESVQCLEYVPNTDQLLNLYKQSVITINMKLHANVFSAALQRPFVNLAYRLKSYDFAESVGFTDLTVSFSESDLPAKILSAVRRLMGNTQLYTDRLTEHTEKYQQKLQDLESEMIALIA